MSLKPGIYEQLVNKETKTNLSEIDEKNKKLESRLIESLRNHRKKFEERL